MVNRLHTGPALSSRLLFKSCVLSMCSVTGVISVAQRGACLHISMHLEPWRVRGQQGSGSPALSQVALPLVLCSLGHCFSRSLPPFRPASVKLWRAARA